MKHCSATILTTLNTLWDDLPVPSVADPTDANLIKPKNLLDCCKDAQEFMDEYDLNDGHDNGTLYLMRVYGHRTRMLSYFQVCCIIQSQMTVMGIFGP